MINFTYFGVKTFIIVLVFIRGTMLRPTESDATQANVVSITDDLTIVYKLEPDSDETSTTTDVPFIEVSKTQRPKEKSDMSSELESWCVIWYLTAFGSLVCFFLVITCTEIFFGNPIYRRNNLNAFIQSLRKPSSDSLPPPYDLFAPPSYYDSIQKVDDGKRKGLDIFVVPVHQSTTLIPKSDCEIMTLPPQYSELDFGNSVCGVCGTQRLMTNSAVTQTSDDSGVPPAVH